MAVCQEPHSINLNLASLHLTMSLLLVPQCTTDAQAHPGPATIVFLTTDLHDEEHG